MKFLTDEKLVIVGAGGMIGSNMLQVAAMMGLTPNIVGYDLYLPALQGAVDEVCHCGIEGVNVSCTDDVKKAFTGAKYIISSGGAPRKDGMTREDLLKGNAEIAAQLGKDIKAYCPDVKHVTIIFNPADITGLVTLLHSGIDPSRLTTLAALDSTRLETALSRELGVPQSKIKFPRTYGGHGESMAVFASTAFVDGKKLTDIIGTPALSKERWEEIKVAVGKGGAEIIKLRGRSSFQSPSYASVAMVRAAMGGEEFAYPSGVYVGTGKHNHIMMAMETSITKQGVTYKQVSGTDDENKALDKSYEHLCKLRDEVIGMGIIPSIDKWHTLNAHIK